MKRIITIKRKLKHGYKSEIGKFLFKNMYRRHQLYNTLVNIAHYKGLKTNGYELDTELFKYIESRDDGYNDYIPGIRSCVCADIDTAITRIWDNRKKGIHSELRFKKFNPAYNAFRVYDKHHNLLEFDWSGTGLRFKVGKGRGNKSIILNLKVTDSIYSNHYTFGESDVKMISFIQKNRKQYICITVEADFKNPKEYFYIKDSKAGCDFGIENPVTLYDGESFDSYSFDHKKIGDLNTRIDRLNKHLTEKDYMSNNYKKLRHKINKLYEKQTNIRRDWRFKVSCIIASKYKTIITDKFEVPICDIEGDVGRYINRRTRDIGMYLFMETFSYMAFKYGCDEIKATPDSTRTCSQCGFVNEPLPLSQRKLKCIECGCVIHRDKNAAINCYNQSI